MNNREYIKALKKALKQQNVPNWNDIVLEIQSHIEESDEQGSLLERFGQPTDLAKEYLDGEKVVKPLAAKAVTLGKKIIIYISVGIVSVIAIVAIAFWWLSKDEFNYADESASELNPSENFWHKKDWDSTINIVNVRSKLVIYWHAENSIRWSCKREVNDVEITQQEWLIKENSCLVFLPSKELSINSSQGDIVMVNAKADISMQIKQTKLRIAENGSEYEYKFSGERYRLKDLASKQGASVKLTAVAQESTISSY